MTELTLEEIEQKEIEAKYTESKEYIKSLDDEYAATFTKVDGTTRRMVVSKTEQEKAAEEMARERAEEEAKNPDSVKPEKFKPSHILRVFEKVDDTKYQWRVINLSTLIKIEDLTGDKDVHYPSIPAQSSGTA